MVDMVIQLPKKGKYNLILSYITESPAWKPSYRVMVRNNGQVELQGWAIVDNTSGEDWKSVRLGVGSSSALSFRYDLHSVLHVHRQRLRSKIGFAKAPPRGGSVHTERSESKRVVFELADADIPRPDDHPDVSVGKARNSSSPKKVLSARYYRIKSNRRIKLLAQKLKKDRRTTILIDGYAGASERSPKERSRDRANLLRNQLIREGVAPARLKVRAIGVVSGRGPGARIVSQGSGYARGANNNHSTRYRENGEPIGRSHFESKSTMTVKRGTSAMVSVVHSRTGGEVVYLYDAEAARGNKRYAFRAVRIKNPSKNTLEAGPVTVYGNGRFIGEGLTAPIPPLSTAIIPFALDRQIVVRRKGSTRDQIARLITLNRGVLTAEVQHTRRTKLKLVNRLNAPSVVFVRHTVRKGWTLTKGPEVFERLGEAHLFKIALNAGQTRTIVIDEATPLTRTIDLRTPSAIKLVRIYLQMPKHDKRFAEPMKKLLAINSEMARHQDAIDSLRERMAEYRRRVNELHGQIFSLKAVKTGGSLMRHLKAKMKQISNRLQRATIEVVQNQEKLMLARIRFQDGLSELTLARRVAKSGAKTPDSGK
jgi:hypothetical protein